MVYLLPVHVMYDISKRWEDALFCSYLSAISKNKFLDLSSFEDLIELVGSKYLKIEKNLDVLLF